MSVFNIYTVWITWNR